MLIQEFLQVEHVFQLEVVSEGPIVQLSLKLVTLDEKKTKTEFCERCSTIELSNRVRMLTAKILSEVDISGTEHQGGINKDWKMVKPKSLSEGLPKKLFFQ